MDEIDVTVNKAPSGPDKNPVGVAECLVNWDKQMASWGVGFVDDKQAISRNLVSEICWKCQPLLIKLRKDGTASWAKCGHGHGGFLRRAAIKKSPGESTVTHYSVYPITAKHNLRLVVQEETKTCFVPTEASFNVEDNEIDTIKWEDLGWLNNSQSDRFDLRFGKEARPALTEYGFDMSVAPYIEDSENPSCMARVSFDRIRMKTEKLQKGMKVGMAVFFTEKAQPTRETIVGIDGTKIPQNFSEAQIESYFGQPDRVNIYTGEILYVGEKHIEYDINSFTGCSGAIVFVLDTNQPAWVDQHDWGKAIAIHSGAHPTLNDRNYGFLINKHPLFMD